jgi:hypothetical protein
MRGPDVMELEEETYAPELCAHCEGAGCCYCDKKGKVLVRQPSKKCHHCDGDGCIYCGFTGWEGLMGRFPPCKW